MKYNKTIYKEILKHAFCLERHSYSPELNKLHLTTGEVLRAPQCTTIEQAAKYAATLIHKKAKQHLNNINKF